MKNWYPSVDESKHAQSQIELSPTPGLQVFTTLTNPPVRGLFAGDNRLFGVSAGDLYEIFSSGAATIIGGILNAQTPVQWAASGFSILVATGDQVWRATTTTAKVIDGAISVVYLDGYYIALRTDGQTIQLSSDDGVSWDPSDVAQSMGPVDRKVRLMAHEGHLWWFGTKSISVWYDSGNADFPFAPIDGATIDQGTMAPWSVTQLDRRLYWLGMDQHGYGRVFRSEGYTPVPISNMAIEHLIKGYVDAGRTDLITGKGYTENGHTFYVLAFPKANATLVYDLATGMWHERARWMDGAWQFWRGASFHAFCFNKHFVARIAEPPFTGPADYTQIYEQGVHIYSDGGNPIRRYRSAPYTQADQQWLFHHYLRLLTKGGSAVTMRYLYDDNSTWSNERTVSPLKNEIKYRRLGRARDRMYEIYLLDSTSEAQSIIEGYLHASPGIER